MIEKSDSNVTVYTEQIRVATDEKQKLQFTTLRQESEIGPIVFIAEAFNKEVNDATKWLILIIIFAFDPLAVALTIGANIALVDRRGHVTHSDLTLSVDTHDDGTEFSTDQIRAALEEFENRPLSAAEIAQKGMLVQMLKRKEVTERVRRGK